MTVERIGEAAGSIWSKLHEKGQKGVSFTEIKKTKGFTTDELLGGVGWLAREGKVCFKTSGRRVLVTLVEAEMFAGV